MATTYHYIDGEIFWALRGLDTKYAPGAWKISLKPSAEGLEEIRTSGIDIKPKDGMYTFRRKLESVFKGVKKEFDPPKFLIQKNGQTVELEDNIGNGSKGRVKVEVYDTSMGKKGHRYLAVLVTDLVPYNPPAAAEAAPTQAIPF